jgi:sulfite exporter TauE/SafE
MFMLGLLGTGHCIGMCGPLIFAFPSRTGKFVPHLFYHLGRTLTYVVIGGAMGAIGAGLAGIAAATGGNPTAWIDYVKVGLRLLAALFLFIFGLSRLGIIPEPGWLAIATPEKIPGYRKVFKSALLQKGHADMFLIGLMLGFLPCGLSFAAFASALPTGSLFKGAIMVFVFAVGTVPGLLILGTGASKIVQRFRKTSDILAGLLMLYMAIKLAIKAGGAVFG